MEKPPRTEHWQDGAVRRPMRDWSGYEGRDGLADGWRRERSARVWQAIQCWALLCCIGAENESLDDSPASALWRLLGRPDL